MGAKASTPTGGDDVHPSACWGGIRQNQFKVSIFISASTSNYPKQIKNRKAHQRNRIF